MKVVINKCFGGFSLSPLAVKRMAELQGKPCYFFKGFKPKAPCKMEEIGNTLFWSAYTVPEPPTQDGWHEMTQEQRIASNKAVESVTLSNPPDDRSNPILIQVIEELGEKADGSCAKLAIVEIPDGIEWEIDEYDGYETIEEKHRSWG